MWAAVAPPGGRRRNRGGVRRQRAGGVSPGERPGPHTARGASRGAAQSCSELLIGAGNCLEVLGTAHNETPVATAGIHIAVPWIKTGIGRKDNYH